MLDTSDMEWINENIKVDKVVAIEEKLTTMRQDWKTASPAYKKLIEANAKILKEELVKLTEKIGQTQTPQY